MEHLEFRFDKCRARVAQYGKGIDIAYQQISIDSKSIHN